MLFSPGFRIVHGALPPQTLSSQFIAYSSLTFPAYAKINLGLLIGEERPDGYHSIETIFHRIDLFDEITLDRSTEITVVTARTNVPSDERNICYKAAQALREHLGIGEGVAISIKKDIPVGAGLGGGSADAGAVLRNLPAFWGRSVPLNVLQAIALNLGSDVPYFLGSGTALARGRGEVLEYFPLDIPYSILVCFPNIHVSTGWAYRNISPQRSIGNTHLKEILLDGLRNPPALSHRLRNDFEPVVFSAWPEIERAKEAMLRGGAGYASMSGSGSALYGFFSDESRAKALEASFRTQGYQTSLTAPHFRTG